MSYDRSRRDDNLVLLVFVIVGFVAYGLGRLLNVALRRLRWIGPRLLEFAEPGEDEDFRTLAHPQAAYPYETLGGQDAYLRARDYAAFGWSLIDAGLPERPLTWADRITFTVIGGLVLWGVSVLSL